MKTAKLMSVLCVAALAIAGCSSTKTTTSPGAMGAKDGCCSDAKGGACTDSKAKTDAKGSMGAVSEKSSCCSGEKKTN